jgi:hypothetical protein
MKMSARLFTILIICTLLTQSVQAEEAYNSGIEQESAVSIELTKLDVNDTKLELSWKIINNTDHDIWTCDSIYWTIPKFEVFLDKDATTLIIRRQFNLPKEENVNWELPKRGLFVRLRPGQEKAESLSLNVPVEPNPVFDTLHANSEFASRLALEIGFFDEDLPNMILRIVELAEKLNCDISRTSPFYDDKEVGDRFFKGVIIARAFYSESSDYFRDSVMSGGDEITIPHRGDWGPVLDGEKVLRIEVDNVSIPYKSNYPPLTSQEDNELDDSLYVEEEQSAVSMELTHFEITDANLELGWKIRNNTDHDVWICDSIDEDAKYGYEVFLTADSQTLLIRRRLDVPSSAIFGQRPYGRYIRIRRGETRQESLVLNLPVQTGILYPSHGSTYVTECARCMVEIGFYDEDLPAMVRNILQVAEKLGTTNFPSNFAIIKDYFRGLGVREWFGPLEVFDALNPDFYVEGKVLITYSYQALTGEKVLRILIDGVSIPYDGYVQFTNQEVNE